MWHNVACKHRLQTDGVGLNAFVACLRAVCVLFACFSYKQRVRRTPTGTRLVS